MDVRYEIDRYIFWENWEILRHSYYQREMTQDELILLFLELEYNKLYIPFNLYMRILEIFLDRLNAKC